MRTWFGVPRIRELISLTYQTYLDAMGSNEIENSISRLTMDPRTFTKPRKAD